LESVKIGCIFTLQKQLTMTKVTKSEVSAVIGQIESGVAFGNYNAQFVYRDYPTGKEFYKFSYGTEMKIKKFDGIEPFARAIVRFIKTGY
jgi:hypothetical protein